MSPTRVPLFWVFLALATGCLLGLDGFLSWPVALGLALVALVGWVLARGVRLSLALFYLSVIVAGLTHTRLLFTTVAPDDLRRLPDDKLLASTQWHGRVADDPRSAPHRNRRALERVSFTVEIDSWRTTGGRLFEEKTPDPWQSATGQINCTVTGPAQDIREGDEVEFAAGLEPIPAALVPGQLDLRSYDAARDIYFEAMVRPLDWRRVARSGPWLRELSYAARDWAYDRLRWGIEDDPRIADFLAGMLIGYRQDIPGDIEQDFRDTGTLHVFAISGQNIAEVVVVAIILLQLVGLVRWRWAWTLAPLILLYCLLTGAPASAVRATVMALAVLLAWRLGRPLTALGCWSIAALAMTIWDPRVLLDPGAQLSFGVVLGLILLSPPIYRLLIAGFHYDPFLPRRLLTSGQEREGRWWVFAMGLLAASIAATIVSEPITALTFHQVTPVSVLANLLVVPMAGIITIVGTVSVVFSLLSHGLAAQINNANWLLAKIMIALVSFFAHEPGAAIHVPDLRVAGQATPFIVVAPLQDSACILVQSGSGTWLIDTGRESSPPPPAARLLQFYGINRLDALVLAQPDTPDNGAADAIAQRFHPRCLAQPGLPSRSPFQHEISGIAGHAGVKSDAWLAGQQFTLGSDVEIEVLGPATDTEATRENDRSLVLLIHAGAGTVLSAGRLDAAGQAELLRGHPGLRTDVLVLSGDAPPDAAFLESLGAKFWLRTPPRQRYLNMPTATEPGVTSCSVWPLEKTGAVTVRFRDGGVELTPWASLP